MSRSGVAGLNEALNGACILESWLIDGGFWLLASELSATLLWSDIALNSMLSLYRCTKLLSGLLELLFSSSAWNSIASKLLTNWRDSCLVFNFDVNWSCFLKVGLLICNLILRNASVHGIVHHSSLVHTLPVHEWILTSSCVIIDRPLCILSHLWCFIILLSILTLWLLAILWDNAATNNA